jgi:hypothetical protein
MISNPDVAKIVSVLMLEINRKVDDSIRLVQQECSTDEFETYRLAAARVLAEVYLEVMIPLYRMNPSLKPEGLKI